MAEDLLESRVAALEQEPKPKTWMERLKEWAGVISIVVTGLYSFPLGLWDRYIETPNNAAAKKTEAIRDSALELTDIDAEFAKTYLSIANEDVRSMYGRALASKKAAILQRNKENIDKYYTSLTPPEIILLAYNFGNDGDVSRASKMLETAREQLKQQQNPIADSDAARMQARLAIRGRDFENAREHYSEAIQILIGNPTIDNVLPATFAAADWGSVELNVGDWKCGQTLLNWALGATATLPARPDVLTYRMQYQAALANAPNAKPGQPSAGCPSSLMGWMKFRPL